MKGKVTRESIARGPKSLWRYRDLLPVDKPVTGFHSGFTPLKRADRLAKQLGCKQLWIKDDSCNYPTYSYKERVVSVAISKAVEFGFDTVGCASTGNLANSTAAHAAQAGIRCFVMIPHDLEQGKVLGSLIFGPTMVRIRGRLRRREPAVYRNRRQVRLGDREREPPPLLHRRRQDLRL